MTFRSGGTGLTAQASIDRTCELGMTRATGHVYEHIRQPLERATRPDS
ncbi:hypothetical protein IT072_17020 [Leifsonia sp. ZF2019]|nr:hypothetical protein [Leifsonia sp. ZF2019]UAJ78898.1 hypothetical protein IT072_17020 [Leifsonia sp. ZF2019]